MSNEKVEVQQIISQKKANRPEDERAPLARFALRIFKLPRIRFSIVTSVAVISLSVIILWFSTKNLIR